MGKILDFILVNSGINWEKYQRVQLYKKIPEIIEEKNLNEEIAE